MKPEQVAAFKNVVEEKIQRLLREYANGAINKAQFNAVYERYHGQLALANSALASGKSAGLDETLAGPPTVAIKTRYMGKALGVVIYHNSSNRVIQTLGSFDIAEEQHRAMFQAFAERRDRGALTNGSMVAQIDDARWLLYVAGKLTSAGVLFRNEPSRQQIGETLRLQRDLETANNHALTGKAYNDDTLANPFLVFIQPLSQKK